MTRPRNLRSPWIKGSTKDVEKWNMLTKVSLLHFLVAFPFFLCLGKEIGDNLKDWIPRRGKCNPNPSKTKRFLDSVHPNTKTVLLYLKTGLSSSKSKQKSNYLYLIAQKMQISVFTENRFTLTQQHGNCNEMILNIILHLWIL